MSRTFRQYEIERYIDAGGMSEVYLGRHRSLGSRWAIKVLYRGLAKDRSFIDRFEREARLASTLQHNNIVQVIDFGREDDDYFIVMQYVDGPDLSKIVKQLNADVAAPHRFPLEIVLLILEEIAHGLRAAHALNLVHRDIKPSNILINRQGEVKIADFGLARDFRKSAQEITLPGTILGTPSYMSPEQAAGVADLDTRSDIFSLGIIVYQLLTGEKPFKGNSPTEIQHAIINAPPPRLTRVNCPRLYPELGDLVDRMLRKDRDKRLQSMDEVLHAIGTSIQALPEGADLAIRRREHLASFSADPMAYSQELRRHTISSHLRLGYHLKSMGVEKLNDSLQQFQLVLSLDPENVKAAEAILELQRDSDASDVTPPVGLAHAVRDASQVTRRFAQPGNGESADDEGKRRRRSRRWLLVPAVAALAVAALLVFSSQVNDDPTLPSPPDPTPLMTSVVLESDPPRARVWYRRAGSGAFRDAEIMTDCVLADLEMVGYEFRFELAGFLPETLVVDLAAGAAETLRVALAPARGILVLRTIPPDLRPAITIRDLASGAIAHEGTGIARSPIELAPGTYSATFELSGFERCTRELRVRSSERSVLEVPLLRITTADDDAANVDDQEVQTAPTPTDPPGVVHIRCTNEVTFSVGGTVVWRGQGPWYYPVDVGVLRQVVLAEASAFARREWNELAVDRGDTLVFTDEVFSYGEFTLTANVPVELEIDGRRLEGSATRHELRVGAGLHDARILAQSDLAVANVLVMEPSDAPPEAFTRINVDEFRFTARPEVPLWINLRLVRSR